MKRKVLEIHEGNIYLECIKDDAAKTNPFRLYRKWWDGGWHRKQIEKYGNFESIIYHIHDMMRSQNLGWG